MKANLRKYYILIVVSILGITIVSQVVIRRSLDLQGYDGQKINFAGFQSFTSAELAKQTLILQRAIENNDDKTKNLAKKEVNINLQKLEDIQEGIMYGTKYGISGENSENAKALLKEAEITLFEIKELYKSLVNSDNISDEQLSEMAILTSSYSNSFKKIGYEFQLTNSTKISNLKFLEMMLASIMVVVLLIEIFFVIRPALKRLDEYTLQLLQSNKELEQSNKVKTEFLANMSHEIRTPLNGVIGMSQLLSKTDLKTDQKESVNTIIESAQNLLVIVNEILDYSKIEAGKLEVEKTDFSLSQLIEEIIELLSPTTVNKDIDIMSFVDPNLPKMITSDFGKVRQILINLIGNAIKFTEKGEILVQARIKDIEDEFFEVEFSIKDSGIGIQSNKIEKIFSSFTQADNSTTRKYGGTGLGLSICKDLVELLNGQIWAESEAGQGSTFSFSIVVESASEIKLREKIGAFQLKKALIVDDNHTNLKILVNTLSSWGVSATPFNSPELVLSLGDGLKNFDIFILDMQMPDIDGLELAKQIKTLVPDHKAPIILLSSIPESLIENSDSIDFDYFLNKPLKQIKLLDILSDVWKTSIQEHIKSAEEKGKPTSIITNAKNLKILVAEDNAINKAVAKKSLELLGYNSVFVDNGLGALEIVQSELFDLILMDIQMPVMDGFEATKKIRRTLSINDQPIIIAMTAASLGGDEDKYIQEGMNDLLPKPLDVDLLASKINHWFPEI